ncbi:MAG: hypothetical protein AAF533_01790 [Acidobacteriota bacterium]
MSAPNRTTDREAQAHVEIGHTEVEPSVARALSLGFVLLLLVVPLVQAGLDLASHRRGERSSALPSVLDLLHVLPGLPAAHREAGGGLRGLLAANRRLLAGMTAHERSLEDASFLNAGLVSPVRLLMSGALRQGTEDSYLGRPGWLFFRPGVDHLTGPAFHDARHVESRRDAAPSWDAVPGIDPTPAILQLHRDLAERDIALVVLPVPGKAAIHPEQLASGSFDAALQNPSTSDLLATLAESGVTVVDLRAELFALARGDEVFLRTDSHWSPIAVELAAARLATTLRDLGVRTGTARLRGDAATVDGEGDIVRMLSLPEEQDRFPAQRIELRRVSTAASETWRPSREAEVLLLGDSFTNVFSLPSLGWGEDAGLAEQLALELEAPVDRIAVNAGGAVESRRVLHRELASGRDRLADKKVVVWELAERELSFGDWEVLPLVLGEPRPSRFVTAPDGWSGVVEATVLAASVVPRPRSVPYADHVMTLHLADPVSTDLMNDEPATELLAHVHGMRDHRWTPAARLRPGQRVKMTLRPWAEVEDELGGLSRSELDDEDLLFEEPLWIEDLEVLR